MNIKILFFFLLFRKWLLFHLLIARELPDLGSHELREHNGLKVLVKFEQKLLEILLLKFSLELLLFTSI